MRAFENVNGLGLVRPGSAPPPGSAAPGWTAPPGWDPAAALRDRRAGTQAAGYVASAEAIADKAAADAAVASATATVATLRAQLAEYRSRFNGAQAARAKCEWANVACILMQDGQVNFYNDRVADTSAAFNVAEEALTRARAWAATAAKTVRGEEVASAAAKAAAKDAAAKAAAAQASARAAAASAAAMTNAQGGPPVYQGGSRVPTWAWVAGGLAVVGLAVYFGRR